MPPRPYKIRNQKTGELIEFEFDGVPTPDDIQRIIASRKSENKFTAPPRRDNISLPSFDSNPEPITQPRTREQPNYFNPPSLSSIGDWATRPLMPDVEEDISNFAGKYGGPVAKGISDFALGGSTSPVGLATLGLGGGILTAAARRVSRARKPLSTLARNVNKVDDVLPPLNAMPDNTSMMPHEFQADMPPITGPVTKPRMRMLLDDAGNRIGYEPLPDLPNLDDIGGIPPVNIEQPVLKPSNRLRPTSGFSPNKNMGVGTELPVNKGVAEYAGQQPGFEELPPIDLYNIPVEGSSGMSTVSADSARKAGYSTPPPPANTTLSADLRGAKPRFNMGNQSYIPAFESDIDKAMFIVAQKTPSKRDADYMKFLVKATGMDENQIRNQARVVRNQIKINIQGKQPGDVPIPRIWRPPTNTNVGSGGLPPLEPPPMNNMGGSGGGDNIPPFKEASMNDFKPDLPKMDIRKAGPITELINLPKGTWASFDLSAPLRQGKGLIHKKAFYTSLKPMFQALKSEESFRTIEDAIKAKPTFKRQVDSGLALSDLADVTKREEQIMSTWAEKIPGVRASNRAYTTFLNKLRSDTFDSMIKLSDKAGGITDDEKIAKFINEASGRGSLDFRAAGMKGNKNFNILNQEKNAVELNNLLFSPRYVSSRLRMLGSARHAFDPRTYLKADRAIQKEYVKSLLATATYWAGGAAFANAMGADINMDPSNSDFAKIKIGNTRVDTLAGLQQPLVAAYRLISGEKTSPTTGNTKQLGVGYKPETRLDIVENFGRSKASPAAGFAYDLIKGFDMSGKPMGSQLTRTDTDNYLYRMFIPNIAQTLIELAKEDPELIPLAIPATFGEGVQVFDEYTPKANDSGYVPTSQRGGYLRDYR